MGLLRKLAEIRERQILEHAEPFLDEGEKVLSWVRISKTPGSGRGFLFVTERRLIISWSKIGQDDNSSLRWDEIVSWGLATYGDTGPIFAVETEDSFRYGHIVVETEGMVTRANGFVTHFIDNAPASRRPLRLVPDPGVFDTSTLTIERERKTFGKHTRRIVVTIIGVALLILGVILLIAPGPGILVTLGGLAILATEYDWAGDFMTWVKRRYEKTRAKLRARRSPS